MKETDKHMELTVKANRLEYLLELYDMSKEDLTSRLSGKRKKTTDDLNSFWQTKKISLGLLKKIDKIFEKGLTWYLSERPLPERKSSSVFFRKNKFNTELNFAAKKIINKFEEKKFQIQTLCNYINYDTKRILKNYSIDYNPENAAKEIHAEFDVAETKLIENKQIKIPQSDFGYLKNCIQIIGEFNVFVFEFVEAPRKKQKANFNGFFIHPNIISVKRQKYTRREIFTLIHEFAHYLLNSEEIEELTEEDKYETLSKIEKWCSDFTYFFLIGKNNQKIENLEVATKKNSFCKEEIETIFSNTMLSYSAIYTRLRIINKISQNDYEYILNEIRTEISKKENETAIENEKKKALQKELGKPISFGIQKPIQSSLFKEIVKINYFQENIDESRLCELLKIKPERIEKEIYSHD